MLLQKDRLLELEICKVSICIKYFYHIEIITEREILFYIIVFISSDYIIKLCSIILYNKITMKA